MRETILVPTDGSSDGDRAVEAALELAEREDATLHALFVVDTRQYAEPALSSLELLSDEEEDHGHDVLVDIERRAAERGVETVTRCCHGRPAEAIVAYADEVDADLVLVGGRDDGKVRIGHNAAEVLERSRRPVYTV